MKTSAILATPTAAVPEKDIRRYIRDKDKRPYGIIIAVPSKHPSIKYHIGYSQANRKLDKFSKNEGLALAIQRINAAESEHVVIVADDNIPHEIKKALPAFIARCQRYFK